MLLSLDASLSQFSWCISQDASIEGECLRLKHYESLPNYLEDQFNRLQILPRDISKIAVIIGPGNYTGLRATLAMVRTWHMLYNTPVICKNRLETMLYYATQNTTQEVMISQSVRMDEFFILKGRAHPDRDFVITQELLKIKGIHWTEYANAVTLCGDSFAEEKVNYTASWENLAPILAKWATSLKSESTLSNIIPLYIREAAQSPSQTK